MEQRAVEGCNLSYICANPKSLVCVNVSERNRGIDRIPMNEKCYVYIYCCTSK